MTNTQLYRRDHGMRFVRSDQLDFTTAQRPGTMRAVAIDRVTAGAKTLWVGMVTMPPQGQTAPHHHGGGEAVLYVVSGRVRMRWGARSEFVTEAGPGDFLYVAPYVPHQAIHPTFRTTHM